MSPLHRLLRGLAIRNARLERVYLRVCRPNSLQWADMLRERGDFRSMGEHCAINPSALIEGRELIRLGDNVRLANCSIFCSDGSVNMINRAFGLNLDNVGKVDIRSNVFVGFGAIILPGVTIGPNAIVTVGSVVRSNVAEGDVVAGVPAKRVGRVELSVEMLKAKNKTFPWRHLIEKRAAEFDAGMEAELQRMRAEFFYGPGDSQSS